MRIQYSTKNKKLRKVGTFGRFLHSFRPWGSTFGIFGGTFGSAPGGTFGLTCAFGGARGGTFGGTFGGAPGVPPFLRLPRRPPCLYGAFPEESNLFSASAAQVYFSSAVAFSPAGRGMSALTRNIFPCTPAEKLPSYFCTM